MKLPAPSRRLKITACGASADGLIHADHVTGPPVTHSSCGAAGTVTAVCPSKRSPPATSEPAAGGGTPSAFTPLADESVDAEIVFAK